MLMQQETVLNMNGSSQIMAGLGSLAKPKVKIGFQIHG